MTAPAPETAAGAVSMPGPRPAVQGLRAIEAGVVLVMVAWAANFVVVKAAIATVPPIGFAFIRFSLAAVVMLGVLRWREGSIGLPRHLVVPVALLGGLGFGLYQALWAFGLATTSAGTSALLIAATPVFTALVAVAMRIEQAHAIRFAGIAVSFAGVALVAASEGLRLDAVGLGALVTIVAAACWGSYLALSAPFLAELSPLRLTTWAIVAGAAFLVLPGSVQLAGSDLAGAGPGALGAILYSGIAAAGLANVVIFRAIAVVGASPVANLQFLVPALTVLFAAVFLGERVTPIQLLGGAVIVAGIGVARRAPAGPPPGGRHVPEPPPLMET